MRSSILRSGIRAVSAGRVGTFCSIVRCEPIGCRNPVLSNLFRFLPPALCLEENDILLDISDGSTAVGRCSFPSPDSDTEAQQGYIGKILLASFSKASPNFPVGILHGTGIRPWSSVPTAYETNRPLECGKGPHAYQEGQSDETRFEVSGRGRKSGRYGDGGDGFQGTVSKKKKKKKKDDTREASPVRIGNSGVVDLEGDCIEVQGDGPLPAVSEKMVPKLRTLSKQSATKHAASVLTSYGKGNRKLLLSLGANEEQMTLLLKRHPEFGEPQAPPFLMESVRLFEKYGMDSRLFMRVLGKINMSTRYNVFLHVAPHKPEQVFIFLRETIGVKDLGKVVRSTPSLLLASLKSLKERVKSLEDLEFAVNGKFVEVYGRHLLRGSNSLREKVEALKLAAGPRCFLRQPLLLGVKAEDVAMRVANLEDILGGAQLARDYLNKNVSILQSKEATVKEVWVEFTKYFGESKLGVDSPHMPYILSRNWKTIVSKFDYLSSKGISQGELLRNLNKIIDRSLEKFIKPRVEQALKHRRTKEGCPDLYKILSGSHAVFEERFDVSVDMFRY